MAEKIITIMVLKVDLECTKCYKKVKKLLCKYPQIRDQIYDEKANTVTIMVVCCSPEKIRDKLCQKGGGTIKRIDIKEPEKKKAPEPDKKKEPEPEKPKPKPVENPPDSEKPRDDTPKNVIFVLPPKVDTPKPSPVKAHEPGPKANEPPLKAPESAPKAPEPIPVPIPITAYPPPYFVPPGVCCGTCYEGLPGGPCYGGHGMLMPMGPPPCNCGCGGRSNCYSGYGGGGYSINRCDYFSEENPSACTVM